MGELVCHRRVAAQGLSTAVLDPVYVVHYSEPITLERARLAQQDYEDVCWARAEGPMALLMLVDHPLPMPSTPVRRYWREAAQSELGFGPIALVAPSLSPVMTSAASYLAEQLIAVLGVHIQIFWAEDEACRWLSTKLDEVFEPEALTHAASELRQRERRAG